MLLLFFLLGFFDDLKSLSPFLRLNFQFLFATISWIGIVKFEGFYFSHKFLNEFLPLSSNLISYFLTVIWTVGVINAIKLD